jgi:hypothetical protein
MKLYIRSSFIFVLFLCGGALIAQQNTPAKQGFRLKKYKFDEMPVLGTYGGLVIKEGGISGIVYQNGVFFLPVRLPKVSRRCFFLSQNMHRKSGRPPWKATNWK